MQFNFNGKIADWEASAAQAIGTSRAYADAALKLLSDIRDAVSSTTPEKKILTYYGTTDTNPGTQVNVTEIPAGQQYNILHVGTVVNATNPYGVTLRLDGRVVGTFGASSRRQVLLGAGLLTADAGTASVSFMVQLEQVTKDKTRTNDGFAGKTPNAGLMTGGEIDQNRHFDSQRFEVTNDGTRR